MPDDPVPPWGELFYISPGDDKASDADKQTESAIRVTLEKIAKDQETYPGISLRKWQRLDEPGAVMWALVRHLDTAAVVVANLTGNNANVYYEVGLAHALRTHVILLIREHGDPLFDLRDLQRIDVDHGSDSTLEGDLRAALSKVRDARDADRSTGTAVDRYLAERDRGTASEARQLDEPVRLRFAAWEGLLRPVDPLAMTSGLAVVDKYKGRGVVRQVDQAGAEITVIIDFDDETVREQRLGPRSTTYFHAPW